MTKITVRIANPVKLAGEVFMPGEHEVDPEIAEEMAAAGVLAPEGGEDIPAEVRAEDPDPRLADLEAERDAALASQAELEVERDELLGQVADLQGQIETLQKASAPTGGADAADAKPAKKGTASPKG